MIEDLLKESAARARDALCPDELPEHWAAQHDRRYLLQLVDSLRAELKETHDSL